MIPDINYRSFLLYQSRWQLSAVVLAVPLAYFSNYVPAWLALSIAHVLGAAVFYPVDKVILDSD